MLYYWQLLAMHHGRFFKEKQLRHLLEVVTWFIWTLDCNKKTDTQARENVVVVVVVV
jgi:hypothetical protein